MKFLAFLLTLVALPAMADTQPIYGRYENVFVSQVNRSFQAKLDTGAYTASLSAKDIEYFSRDGKDWVRFHLGDKNATDKLFEMPIFRIAKIKERAEESGKKSVTSNEPKMAKRPVVMMTVCIGDVSQDVEVNLTDRSHFAYPLLIGAKAIRKFGAAIDPAKRYTVTSSKCAN